MIRPFWLHNLIKVSIPVGIITFSLIRATLLLFLAGIIISSLFISITQAETMKVHPLPKKRNITFGYDIESTLSEAHRLMSNSQKKLRRLPHIFSKVLELPFGSNADVLIEENSECFRFIAATDDFGQVMAHAIEIHPGVTKIVVRGNNALEFLLDDLELDKWRFRLPPSTRPELASAAYVHGELIVTVPKVVDFDNSGQGSADGGEVWEEGNGELNSGLGRLVLVQ